MISEQDKQAILNGAYGVARDGCKAKLVFTSNFEKNNSPYLFVYEETEYESYSSHWLNSKFCESEEPDSEYDIVGLWQDKPEPFDLGRAKSDTRPLTNDELESGYYDEQSHVIEPPELIKVNNFNNWISVKDRLPEITDHKGFMRSDVVLGFGKEEKDETVPTYSLVYVISGNRFYSGNGECYQITHWAPLPPPPITND